MKNSKKGISLIVLIITIIVIIILATAILVSVINNNPISEANKARYESDRDNMQAVFTNTVGKIMAENQGVVNVTAGQINTVTKDASEATGEVAYTVDNAMVAANASGTIKFDKGTNDATTYYTGKKLPIYTAGETKWYVDSEGVLSLEVAGVKYGTGEDSEEMLVPGAYYTDGTYKDWDILIMEGKISDSTTIGEFLVNGYGDGFSNQETLETIVLKEGTGYIHDFAFWGCTNLKKITIPKSVIEISDNIFGNCSNLTNITYNGTKNDWNSIAFFENASSSFDNPVEITVHCTDGDIIIPANQ